MEFTDKERQVLHIVQSNLPDSLTPYKDIAEQVGLSEDEVLHLLQNLKDQGVIRRFGASIKHQRVGFSHNAMVAWKIADELIDEIGAIAAKSPNISHCYHRPTPDKKAWPYTLFTMIHGMKAEEIQDVIDGLVKETALEEYAILESIKELKKTSMTYF